MDDPSRPTSVPLEAETILWFEFLLNPALLTTHLSKDNASPTPIELILKFLSMAPENQSSTTNAAATTPDIESAMNRNEGLKIGRKQLALKILSLKVASYLKWNLKLIERNLSPQKQVQLLSDLCSVTSGKLVNLPLSMVQDCQLGPEGSKRAFNFALALYHRWVLRAQVLKEIPPRVIKQGFNYVLTNQDQATSFRDEMFLSSFEPFTQQSIDFLNQICRDDEPFTHLTYGSFVALCPNMPPDRLEQDFDNSITISKAELRAQIAYDLCIFYLYDKKYELAREKANECRENLNILKKEYAEKKIDDKDEAKFLFCTFTDEELDGCLMACGLYEVKHVGLIHRMNESIMNGYKDITNIFEEDNIKMEIPLVNRRIVELDMEGECTNDLQKIPKEVVARVSALNMMRSIINYEDIFSPQDFLQKYQKQNGFSLLLEAAISIVKSEQPYCKNRIKDVFHGILLTAEPNYVKPSEIELIEQHDLLHKSDLEEIKRSKRLHCTTLPIENFEFSPLCTMTDWKMSEFKIKTLELGALKRQLINCTTASAVRLLLVKCTNLIMSSDPPLSMEPWHINPSWIMPIQIKSVLMSMSRGFVQDFTYILVAKAKDLASRHEFKLAINLLNAVKSELQRHDSNSGTTKLNKLIEFEILLIQITQQITEWPIKVIENDVMIAKCKQCLLASQSGESVIPRAEILGACAAMLLNLSETANLVRNERRFPSSDLYAAVAGATIELEQHKSNSIKKVYREAWDLIAPMFAAMLVGSSSGYSSSGSRRLHNSGNLIDDINEINENNFNQSADQSNRNAAANNENDDGNENANNDPNSANDDQNPSTHNDNTNGTTESNGGTSGNSNINMGESSGINIPSATSSSATHNYNYSRSRNNFSNNSNDNIGYGPRDSPAVIVNTNLLPFLQKLRDPLPISIMLSLLARLHNILDDNSNRELNIDYMHLWPTSISNSNSYSMDIVIETLNFTLKQALQYHPQHAPWLRLEGDLEFRNENYESAMTSYVKAIITGSEYCTVNLEQNIDDYIIRRMIKCCSNLGCYMQAAILCQFLEEIDYSLAFKTFLDRSTFKTMSEKSILFSDAMDSYYGCIWDPTLLEFIVNMLTKKGEHTRKHQAIAVLGQLELNANNNDEVKREAASIRQIKFLRSLAKQYLF